MAFNIRSLSSVGQNGQDRQDPARYHSHYAISFRRNQRLFVHVILSYNNGHELYGPDYTILRAVAGAVDIQKLTSCLPQAASVGVQLVLILPLSIIHNRKDNIMRSFAAIRRSRRLAIFVLVLLVIEFLDEFIYGVREAAWPLIRDDMKLSYDEVGLLLSLPNFLGNLIEPGLFILGDVWKRKTVVIGGGVVFTLAMLLTSASSSFCY
jgi:hypothetical protein